MKSLTAGTISGCFVWVILFFITAPCLYTLIFLTSSMTTYTNTAYRIMQPFLCPPNTTLTVSTYNTITTDDSYQIIGAVGHDMNCVSPNGDIPKKDIVVEYLLYWRGFGIVSGIVLAFVLSLLLAAPVGGLVARFMHNTKSTPA